MELVYGWKVSVGSASTMGQPRFSCEHIINVLVWHCRLQLAAILFLASQCHFQNSTKHYLMRYSTIVISIMLESLFSFLIQQMNNHNQLMP